MKLFKNIVWIMILAAASVWAESADIALQIETRDMHSSRWSWMTKNNFRIVMQCQKNDLKQAHRMAWVEINAWLIHQKKPSGSALFNPDSVRVVEYDRETGKSVPYDSSLSGESAYYVPAKIDEWPRKHINKQMVRDPHLSWIRRDGDADDAVYICYFDFTGAGEQTRLAKPAFIGTGDAMSFGKLGVNGYVRGTPLVVDYDNDGDLDIVGALAGMMPEQVRYLYKNNGNALEQGFGKPIQIPQSVICRQVTDVNGDGLLDAVGGGGYYSDVQHKQFSEFVRIQVPLDSDNGKIIKTSRGSSPFITDWDGDGINDVLVGCSYWKEYGWQDAYNADGVWTNGPLRGWFYFFRNRGSNSAFDLEEPLQLMTVDGHKAEVFGNATLAVSDLDQDGDLDLITGEFLDRIYIFKNIGTRENPVLDKPVPLTTIDGEFVADFLGNTVFLSDFNEDGHIDIFTCGENDRTGYLENTGVLNENSMPVFRPIRYLECQSDYLVSGQLPVVNACDFNGDSSLDLVVGNSPGHIGWFKGRSTYPSLTFEQFEYFQTGEGDIRIIAGKNGSIQGPAEEKWGYTVPFAADWDGDGLKDLLVNSILGKIVWYKNLDDGLFAEQQLVMVDWPGAAPKPVWRWWDPEPGEWSTQWRSTVQPIDWDQDGLLDVVAMDWDGFLVLHRRYVRNGKTLLGPGERIFLDRSGEPWQINHKKLGEAGRRKFNFADWDNDGDRDLVVDNLLMGGNVALYKNVTDNRTPQFVFSGSLADIIVSGHTCSPSLVDLDQDGLLDLVMAAEDGHFYVFHRSYIEHKAALQASFVTDKGLRKTRTVVPLFNGKPPIGYVYMAKVTTDYPCEGNPSIYAERNDGGVRTVTLNLKGNIYIGNVDLLDSRYLEMMLYFEDEPHLKASLENIKLYMRNEYTDLTDVIDCNPAVHSGKALFRVNDQWLEPASAVSFEKGRWVHLTVDLDQADRTCAVNTLMPSSIIEKMEISFRGPTKVHFGSIKAVAELKESAE